MSNFPGTYLDGRTPTRHSVSLTPARDGLRVSFGDGREALWPWTALRQTQGTFGSEELRLEYLAGDRSDPNEPLASVLVSDPGLLDAIRAASPGATRRISARWRTARVVGWCLIGLAAAATAYMIGAPALAGWLTPRVPVSWEVAMGQSSLDRFLASHDACGDEASVAAVRGVLDRLVAAIPDNQYAFSLTVVDDTTINAFAAPGGFLIVHSGLIAASETPEQLAGVLAHEVQHVVQRHSTRSIIREVPLRFALASVSGGLETATKIAGTLSALSYRRADEAEADLEGVRLLRAAGIDPSGTAEFMRTLESRSRGLTGIGVYLSSHPPTAERVSALEAAIAGDAPGMQSRPLMDQSAWSRIRRICRSDS